MLRLVLRWFIVGLPLVYGLRSLLLFFIADRFSGVFAYVGFCCGCLVILFSLLLSLVLL